MKRLLILLTLIMLIACTATNQISDEGICDLSSRCDDNKYVEIPNSEITSQMKKYSFEVSGIKINYFTVRGSDGEIRTAFDACDVCGGYKGYRQEGKDVICNNCGRYFSIDDIGTKNLGGGCWPSYLPHEKKDEFILIKNSDLEAGAFRFA